jgi:hypothetical protein
MLPFLLCRLPKPLSRRNVAKDSVIDAGGAVDTFFRRISYAERHIVALKVDDKFPAK